MAKNRLSQVRKSRALTQRALAELADTSQQQIQRIEAGAQGVRLELATKIASVLKCSLSEIFPSLAADQQRRGAKVSLRSERVVREKLVEAGLDPDPALWTVKFFAFDGRIFIYPLASDEKSRLERLLTSDENSIVVFATDTHRIAVNLKKIAATQFLFDVGGVPSSEEVEQDYRLNLHLIGARDPIGFELELEQRSEDEVGEDLSPIQNLFFYLDLGLDDEVLWFDDVDDERVYLRPSEMLVLEAPLICCDPGHWKAQYEGYLEDQEIMDSSPQSAKGTE